MVLYSAGGLFRYREFGMNTLEGALKENREKYQAYLEYRKSLRPKDYHLFSKYTELISLCGI